MRKFERVLIYAVLVVTFNFAIVVHADTPYVPWAIDAHHLSLTVAFLCAAACGVIWDRTF